MEERIRELLEGVIEENGYSLYKVEYVKENNMMFLRLYIDKDGIMEVEDCVRCLFKRRRRLRWIQKNLKKP